MITIRIFVSIITTICLSEAYKILVVSPIPVRSHANLGDGVVKNLQEAGHEITYITSMVPEKPLPNVTIVDVSNNVKVFDKGGAVNIGSVMVGSQKNSFVTFAPPLMIVSKITMENENVQKLLSDKTQHFDAIIADWMFNEVYAGFAGVYNCPLIWLSTVEPHWLILQLIDEIPNPAYNVDILSTGVPPLTFTQRAWELYLQIYEIFYQKTYIKKMQNEIYETSIVPHIRSSPVPSLETLMYNASLILSNSHVSMGIATRLPPNYIQVGGYHIDINVKPLPEDLQRIMDNAKHGVIYFSMGSNLRSYHFPDKVKQELLKVFGELKQTVLWKFEEDLPNRPSNVHTLKWAPQQSILAHKNCILFITHGGLLSTTETIHFGVPIIGIPAFADQFVNVDRSVKKGFAKKVDLSYNVAGDLKIAIQEILSDSRYKIKVKELSFIYHDRTSSPQKDLVHWVEHVVKTGGAPHLRSPSFLMPWYQKLYVDLLLVVLFILIVIKYALTYVLNVLRRNYNTSIKKKIN